ncbi:MAG: nodulation protein NfeD [Deltaproteobacteria bacterium]|nr:nodulation protein NfeD [Deltaproteobacteria bacterium]
MIRMRRWGRRVQRLAFLALLGAAAVLAASGAQAGDEEQARARQDYEQARKAYEEAKAKAALDLVRAEAEYAKAKAKAELDRTREALEKAGGDAAAADAKVDAKAKADAKAEPTETQHRKGAVGLIRVEGGIFAGTADYIDDAIERTQSQDLACLVIELDTPGGDLEETKEIVKHILGSPVPVVVFVSPKGAQAASAGTFVTLAGHVAAMAPGSHIGAAHPVMISFIPDMGGDKDDEEKKKRQDQQAIMNEKVTNNAVSLIESIAKERGRNVDWARKAVLESVSIPADEALKKNVIDLIADDTDDLLAKLDGRKIRLDDKTAVVLETKGAAVRRWDKTLKQRLLGGLANPNLLIILFLIGLAGIAMEFYHPGMIVPGAVGALCLLLAFISMQILPVDLGGLLLVLAGLGLMIGEIYVTSYGMLGIGGAILMVIGGILLVDPSQQPHYMDPTMKVEWTVLIPTVIVLGILFLGIGYYVVRTQRSKVRTGAHGIEGELGTARSEVTPAGGKVFVHGEYWNAVCEEGSIPEGASVEVVRTDGLKMIVKAKSGTP